MPFNAAGLNAPHSIDTLSIHSTNPGVGVAPTPGTELTDAPYARVSATYSAPVGGQMTLQADAVFDLSVSSDQNCQFFGLWAGSTYLGYAIPTTTRNFTEPATERKFGMAAGSTVSIVNPA